MYCNHPLYAKSHLLFFFTFHVARTGSVPTHYGEYTLHIPDQSR